MPTTPQRGQRYGSAFAALLATALTMIAATAPAYGTTFADLTLVYDANFSGGSLGSPVDPLGLGRLHEDSIQFPGSNPTWGVNDGFVQLGVTQPNPSPGLVDAELIARPVDFTAGSLFGMRATFVAPAGPHVPGQTWATVLSFRAGGELIQPSDARGASTIRVNGTTAFFAAPGSDAGGPLQALPPEVYAAIFDPVNPQQYTLQLLVDRSGGPSNATLQVGNWTYSYDIHFPDFTSIDGPAITVIGPTLAINNAPGQSASARLLDFQIFLPPNAVPEPSTWVNLLIGFALLGGSMRRGRSAMSKDAIAARL